MLDLLIGLVADPNRAHGAVAGERLDPLDQRRLAADAVERLDMPAPRRIDDVAEIFEIPSSTSSAPSRFSACTV
jgi:hypothetical protein